jgi:hypothetical protein
MFYFSVGKNASACFASSFDYLFRHRLNNAAARSCNTPLIDTETLLTPLNVFCPSVSKTAVIQVLSHGRFSCG